MRRATLLLALTPALFLAGCGEEEARRAVEDMGLNDVVIGGTPWMGCSDSDEMLWNHTFTALNAKGRQVRGFVCGGAFKGYTVRISH